MPRPSPLSTSRRGHDRPHGPVTTKRSAIMKLPFYARALARLGLRASTTALLFIPVLFAACVLLAHGARTERDATALCAAASAGDVGAARDVIERLADVDARESCGFTPLGLMAAYGHRDSVELLLARGAAVDLSHPALGTPLMLALRNGNIEIARELLRGGADVNARCGGFDPLASAVAANDLECVNLVLDAGADLRWPGRRYSLLTLAVQSSDLEVMQALLAAGVDPNLPDADGSTPLMNAVECDAAEAARLLLLAGADASRADAGGPTPRDGGRAPGVCAAMIELV